MDEKVVFKMHCNQREQNKANMQVIKTISYYCRAEILLGEKEEAREELVKELRRLVHNEDNLSVPQVVTPILYKRKLLLYYIIIATNTLN